MKKQTEENSSFLTISCYDYFLEFLLTSISIDVLSIKDMTLENMLINYSIVVKHSKRHISIKPPDIRKTPAWSLLVSSKFPSKLQVCKS